jgi:hypothetical protein
VEELLNGNNLYVYNDPETGQSIVLYTGEELADESELKTLFEDLTEDDIVSVYKDKETGVLVISARTKNPWDLLGKVHHGPSGGNHRDTYKGVLLTRALSTMQYGRVVIRSQDEFEDKDVKSHNIRKKRGKLVIDTTKNNLDRGTLKLLGSLGVETLEEFGERIVEEGGSEIERRLSVLYPERKVDKEWFSDMLAETFKSYYKNSSYSFRRNKTASVISPGMFVGEQDSYGPFAFSSSLYMSMRHAYEEDYELRAGLLMRGDRFPVAIIAYVDTHTNDLLFLVGENHPGAHRFYQATKGDGKNGIGFDQNTTHEIFHFNAEISVDVDFITESNAASIRAHDRIPLRLEITGADKTNLLSKDSSGRIDGFGDAEEVIQRFRELYGDEQRANMLTIESKLDVQENEYE